MTELSIHDQIDQALETLDNLLNHGAFPGRMNIIRTVKRDLRHLCELARIQEKKKTWWQRVKEWRWLIG